MTPSLQVICPVKQTYSLSRLSNSFDITLCNGSCSELSVEKHLFESKATAQLRVTFACTGDAFG